MKKKYISAIIAALTLVACSKTEDDNNPNDKNEDATYICKGSPVRIYYEPDSIAVVYSDKTFSESSCVMLAMEGYDNKSRYEKNSNAYQEHVNYYADTTYSRRHYIGDDYIVSAMPVCKINVTADRDFDTEHPAGASLNNIMLYKYASAYNLQKSNYDRNIDICYGGDYEEMPLSEFEPIYLIDRFSWLYFTQRPDFSGDYTITVSIDFGKDPVNGHECSPKTSSITVHF